MKRGVCEDGRYMRRMCTGVGEEREIGWERCGEGRQDVRGSRCVEMCENGKQVCGVVSFIPPSPTQHI